MRLKAKSKEATHVIEIRGFIGMLLLFVTKKSKIPIQDIWCPNSVHYFEYATAAFSRSRFQLLLSHITFDNIYERDKKYVVLNNVFI